MSRRDPVRIGCFEPTTDSVAAVRQIVGAHLGEVAPDCRDILLLVASELATNAVMHARTPYLVELTVDGVARIEVTDRAGVGPRLGLACPFTSDGRGLRLVAGLCARWGVASLDDGKVVWAEVALDP